VDSPVDDHDAPQPSGGTGEERRRPGGAPLVLSAAAAGGDLNALARDAAAAGWRLRITRREPGAPYANDVELELSSYEEAAGGAQPGGWLGPPDERGYREQRRPDPPDAWYADRTVRITGTAPTVARACAMLAQAVTRYEAGLAPRPLPD
jgi:hypothetical protein